ncbi:MAG: hypothetical protein SFY32_16610 [Bacteroidota bacterium]|nr:hypothetical protein [Bacteroidota bacterium]
MIKKTFIKYRIRKGLKKKRTFPLPIKLKDAKKIGVIWETSQQNMIPSFEELIHNYCKPSVEIQSIIYADKVNKKVALETDSLIQLKDINFLGKFKRIKTQRFLRNDFDFIFCLSINMPLVIQNILANCNAKVRVGFLVEKNKSLLDFMFKPSDPKNTFQTFGEMLGYIQKLN